MQISRFTTSPPQSLMPTNTSFPSCHSPFEILTGKYPHMKIFLKQCTLQPQSYPIWYNYVKLYSVTSSNQRKRKVMGQNSLKVSNMINIGKKALPSSRATMFHQKVSLFWLCNPVSCIQQHMIGQNYKSVQHPISETVIYFSLTE